MTLQEQLLVWQNNSTAQEAINDIIDDLNDGIINPTVGMTVKDPAIYLIIEIENNRNAYIARQIANIEKAIAEEEV